MVSTIRNFTSPAGGHTGQPLQQQGAEAGKDRAADPDQHDLDNDLRCVPHEPSLEMDEVRRAIAATVSAATARASGATDTHSTVFQPYEVSRLPE